MENKRGFHITIVENKTGKTLDEFDTKGIAYVHLIEVDEAEAMKDEEGVTAAHAIGFGQNLDGVNPFGKLSIMEGLQIMIQDMQENDPMLQLLLTITETKRKQMPNG